MTFTYGSAFAGVGGFDKGLDEAGWDCRWQIEINDQARSVLERHWPDVPKYTDIQEVDPSGLERVDLVCGGFPCQDVSVAGKRAGLAGERSGLFFEFRRLLIQLAPRWVLIENVDGLLSSNDGRDMGTVLGALGELGYGWAYRSFDSQFFGVPQRRLRVFIVGRAGGDVVGAAKVLLEPNGGEGSIAKGRSAREVAAARLGAGAADGGRLGVDIAHTVLSNTQGGQRTTDLDGVTYVPVGVSKTLESHASRYDHETETFVPTFRKSRRAHTDEDWETWEEDSVANTLNPPDGGNDVRATDVAVTEVGVRRLLPLEWERLQGFPDGWTDHLSDSARYRGLGNAVSVPVPLWIGTRLMEVDNGTR